MRSCRSVALRTWKSAASASVLLMLMLAYHLHAQEVVGTVDAPATARSNRRPLKLRTAYEVKERIKQVGGGADLGVYDLTFEFTNTLPIPVRVAFPPIGLFFGDQAPFAKADDANLPKFARVSEIVEFSPHETRTWTSTGHAMIGLPGQYEWVFGRPSHGPLPENLFVGSVYSVPEPKAAKNREQRVSTHTEQANHKLHQQTAGHDQSRFREAYSLIHPRSQGPKTSLTTPDFSTALSLLQKNLAETPDAIDVDYDYGWAMVCAAHLGDFRLAWKYYEVIQTQFYGWQTSTNAHRNWDTNCKTVRDIISRSNEAEDAEILKKMESLDNSSAEALRRETVQLVEQSKQGDEDATTRLKSRRYQDVLVDIITGDRHQ